MSSSESKRRRTPSGASERTCAASVGDGVDVLAFYVRDGLAGIVRARRVAGGIGWVSVANFRDSSEQTRVQLPERAFCSSDSRRLTGAKSLEELAERFPEGESPESVVAASLGQLADNELADDLRQVDLLGVAVVYAEAKFGKAVAETCDNHVLLEYVLDCRLPETLEHSVSERTASGSLLHTLTRRCVEAPSTRGTAAKSKIDARGAARAKSDARAAATSSEPVVVGSLAALCDHARYSELSRKARLDVLSEGITAALHLVGLEATFARRLKYLSSTSRIPKVQELNLIIFSVSTKY